MEPQNPSNDVSDPAEEQRVDMPAQDGGTTDQVGESQAEVNQDPTPAPAAPVYNDPTPQTQPQQDTEGQPNEESQNTEVTPEAPQEQPNQNPDYPASDNS